MPQDRLIGRIIAGYRLLERVGEGGTAEVYRAEHPQHGLCAFKLLRPRLKSDPTAVERFLREAGYGTRVRHAGVVRTYQYGEDDGLHFLALEWATGEPLAALIHRSAPVAPQRVAPIIRQLADALAAAHVVGIIHRDLKPENIMFDESTGATKLLDFGIARDEALGAEDRLTRSGFFVGTLHFVAPEALSGDLVDARADIYSLATIAYVMLTGRHPFTGRTPREMFQQLLVGEPTPLRVAAAGRRLPPALEEVVMRGLARDLSQRQPSVTAFAAAFEVAAAGAEEPPAHGGLLRSLRHILRL